MNINDAFQLATDYYYKGTYQHAEHICREILKEYPDNAETLYFLGIIYIHLEKHDSAIQYLYRSLQSGGNYTDTYLALGTAFQQKGQLDDAIYYYNKTISLDPYNVNALNLLGNAYKAKGQLDEAIKYFQKIINFNPNLAVVYNNLGAAHLDRHADEAIKFFQKALLLDPNLSIAYFNLGNAFWEQCKIDQAIEAFDKAIELNPKDFSARFARCISRLPILYVNEADIQESRKSYHDELIKLRSTLSLETREDIENAFGAAGMRTPFFLAYQGFNDRELQQLYGDLVCKIMSAKYPHFEYPSNIPSCLDGEPLRIGFVSKFFYQHPVWKTVIKGWIKNIDKQRFKLYGYHTGITKDNQTEIARKSVAKFVEDIHSLEGLCNIIREDNLHVLIYPEIGMDTITMKLAALKLAPIQCVSWGHPETSGLPTIDYFLSSDLMELPDTDDHYSEKLIRLPNLSIYYEPPDFIKVIDSRDEFELHPEHVVYHCCQSLFKYLPQYDEVFPSIAQRVENCKFLFSSYRKSSVVTEQFQHRIKHAFRIFGLDPDEYVIFLPYLDLGKYNAIYHLANIFLDPICWTGCNSALEAIVCNLPIVTYPGDFMRSREGLAILTMLGIQDTIASSVDEYIELAVKLGNDPKLRYQISEKIMMNKHRIYFDRTCIDALEDFLEKASKGIHK